MPRGSTARRNRTIAEANPQELQNTINSLKQKQTALSDELKKSGIKANKSTFNRLNNILTQTRSKLRSESQKRVSNRGQYQQDQKVKQLQNQVDQLTKEYNQIEYAIKSRASIQNYADQIKYNQTLLKDVNNYQAGLRKEAQRKAQREVDAQKALTSARTQAQYAKALMTYRDTKFASPYFGEAVKQAGATKALASLYRAQNIGKGSAINRASSNVEMLLAGYSQKQFNDLIRWEDANSKIAKRQSAGLRAGGVKQNFSNPTFSVKPSPDPLKFFNNPSSKNTMSARVTSTDPATARANAEQKAYVASLRSGGVSTAEALLNPRTPQTYYVKGKQVPKSETSINLERFLTERGYDISKPELIPNSVFKPEKQLKARQQASQNPMGDLRKVANTYPTTSPQVLKERQEIRDFFKPQINTTQTTSTPQGQVLAPNLQQFANPNSMGVGGFTFGGQPIVQAPRQQTQVQTQVMKNSLMPQQPITLQGSSKNTNVKVDQWGVPYTDPYSSFFGAVAKGASNVFESNVNMFRNIGEFATGQEQTPLSKNRTPIVDSFFGAGSDSIKNFFYGDEVRKQEGRAKDPLGNFFDTQSKRDPRIVGAELGTEALLWAIPVAPIAKGASAGAKFLGNFFGRTATASTKTKGATNTIADTFNFFGKTASETSTLTGKLTKTEAKEIWNAMQRGDIILTPSQTNLITNALSKKRGQQLPNKNEFDSISDFIQNIGNKKGSPNTTPSNTKPSNTKPSNTKPSSTKPSNTKPSNTKPSNTKPSNTKPNPVDNFFGNLPKKAPKPRPPKNTPKPRFKPNDFFVVPRPKATPPKNTVPDFFPKPRPDDGITTRPTDGGSITRRPDPSYPARNPDTGYPARNPDGNRPPDGTPSRGGRSGIGLPFGFPSRGGGGGSGRIRKGLRRGNRINTAWNVNPNKVLGFFKGADFKQSYGTTAFWELDRKTIESTKKAKKERNTGLDFFKPSKKEEKTNAVSDFFNL